MMAWFGELTERKVQRISPQRSKSSIDQLAYKIPSGAAPASAWYGIIDAKEAHNATRHRMQRMVWHGASRIGGPDAVRCTPRRSPALYGPPRARFAGRRRRPSDRVQFCSVSRHLVFSRAFERGGGGGGGAEDDGRRRTTTKKEKRRRRRTRTRTRTRRKAPEKTLEKTLRKSRRSTPGEGGEGGQSRTTKALKTETKAAKAPGGGAEGHWRLRKAEDGDFRKGQDSPTLHGCLRRAVGTKHGVDQQARRMRSRLGRTGRDRWAKRFVEPTAGSTVPKRNRK